MLNRKINAGRREATRLAAALLLVITSGSTWAAAGVSVSGSGTPSYGVALHLPPGIAGMTPNLGLSYTGGGVNGPVGYGWTIQGISTITRCPGNMASDGAIIGVTYTPKDKLCLDGQRLIETDPTGVPSAATAAANGASNAAVGYTSSTAFTEFRTEKDTYARIRAYGAAGNNANAGPLYFKVWTKSGQIYEYGASLNADGNTNALIPAQGTLSPGIPMAWAVSRISDTLGNYIDFKYIQRDTGWGSGPSSGTTPQLGREWNLVQVQYTGNGTQQPTNVVVFDYADRADAPNAAQDRAEAYQQGSKNVSISRLRAIRTYINWKNPTAGNPPPLGVVPQGTSYTFPNVPSAPTTAGNVTTPPTGAVEVSVLKLAYTTGPMTGRSLVSSITECAGTAETQCQPATTFNYSTGGDQSYQADAVFKSGSMATLKMLDATTGNYGVVLGDFNGDGKTDILRWGNTPSDNQLWLSSGNGAFFTVSGTNPTVNIYNTKLFSADGCYSSIVADFNGDGISDILRVANSVNAGGGACTADSDLLFISNGDGTFKAPVTIPSSIDLTTVKVTSRTHSISCTPNLRGPIGTSTSGVPQGFSPQTTCSATDYSQGKSFVLLDVNGDGILDIVTSISPAYTIDPVNGNTPPPDAACSSVVCTHVYFGSTTGNGTFTEYTSTNLVHHSMYADPPNPGGYSAFVRPATVDIDGDGLTDLLVNSGAWISAGNGNFTLVAPYSGSLVGCAFPLDFNGDGRLDCLSPTTVSGSASNQGLAVMNGKAQAYVYNFNLTVAGDDLWGQSAANNYQQSVGVLIGDFNGDGRSDILRWEDDPTKNVLFLSNGDGSFRTSSSFTLNATSQGLRNSDGKTAYLVGDFSGHGTLEILRMKDTPTAGNDSTINQIYERIDPSPPDLLVKVTSPTGLKSVINYVPLTLPTYSGVSRYSAGAAVLYPKVNVIAPMYVVAEVVNDTGIGTGTVPTEYAYQGLRAHLLGRGLLGFARTLQQSYGPDGSPLTVITDYLQDQPYIGVASVSRTAQGTLASYGVTSVSLTTNAYCDTTSTSPAPVITTGGTAPAACGTAALVQRPYLAQTLEQGWDLGGTALSNVTTTNTFNGSGDPLTIGIKTTGTGAGVAQTFTKTTTNTYNPDVTSCSTSQTCSWILGRLSQSTVASTVPNSLAQIATSAGTGAYATATQGNGTTTPPPPTINPAALSAILSLLLSD